MCEPRVLDALTKALNKGQFPLLSDSNKPLWECLCSQLENNPKAFVAKIKNADSMFPSTFEVGGADFATGFDEIKMLICYAHERLSHDHGIAKRQPWQGYIQRLRKVLKKQNYIQDSQVSLLMHPITQMGSGLPGATVTIVPDASLGVGFGSCPDQVKIAAEADCWAQVKKRAYVGVDGSLGRKPHYVLAHLLNHNLNGSGADKLNVVPFWAKANTEMSQKVEGDVKTAVLMGVSVVYTITLGPPVKEDAAYMKWHNAALPGADKTQKKIMTWEKELPQFLKFSAVAVNSAGTSVNIVPPGTIVHNYVPQTLPVWK